MRTFSKPAIDVSAQLQLLKHRGLNVQDEVRAESFLQSVSFFRLSPYMRPFQQPEDVNSFSQGRTRAFFAALCILNHFMHQLSPNSHWDQRLH